VEPLCRVGLSRGCGREEDLDLVAALAEDDDLEPPVGA